MKQITKLDKQHKYILNNPIWGEKQLTNLKILYLISPIIFTSLTTSLTLQHYYSTFDYCNLVKLRLFFCSEY